jgi:ankyrin repeat protein
MVDQYADAAQDSRCFLHAASSGNLDVIRYMHGLNPQAVLERDSERNTSLHWACQNRNGNVDVIEYVLRLNPSAMGLSNNMGNLPLHTACQHGMGEAVLRFLLLQNPDAITLHLAASHGGYRHIVGTPAHPGTKNGSILSMLINSYPDTIREFDSEGRLPLHYACHRGISITDIKLLVKLYPPSIRVVSPRR